MTRTNLEVFHTENAPQLDAHPSHAVLRYGDIIFASGQIPVDPASGQFAGGDTRNQIRRAMENLPAVPKASGRCFENVVKSALFLGNIDDFAEFDEAFYEFFPGQPPARSTFGTSLADPLGLEAEIIAVVNEANGAA